MNPTDTRRAGCFGRGVGVILAILFVILAPLTLVLFDVQQNLLQPDVYKAALAEQHVYEQLPALVGEQILRSITYNPCEEDPSRCEGEGEPDEDQGQGGPPIYFASLSQQDREAILSILVPTSWLREQGESAIDQVFAFLDSDAPTLKIVISMAAIRERLTGPVVESVLLRILRGSGLRGAGGMRRGEEQRLEVAVLDPVLPTHLLDHQLGVRPHFELVDPDFDGPLEPGDEGRVLGDVVRGDADRLAARVEHGSVLRFEDVGVGGRPGVPARAAVRPEERSHASTRS